MGKGSNASKSTAKPDLPPNITPNLASDQASQTAALDPAIQEQVIIANVLVGVSPLPHSLVGDHTHSCSFQEKESTQKSPPVTRTRKRLREIQSQSASTSRPQTRSKAGRPNITKR